MQFLARLLRMHFAGRYEYSACPKSHALTFNGVHWLDSRLKKVIVWGDRALRNRLQIFEFTQDHSCILRASLTHAKYSIKLATGDQIRRGDLIAELHFWNERLIEVLSGQSLLCRGVRLRYSLHHSLAVLAKYLEQSNDMPRVKAIHARLARSAQKPFSRHRPFGFEFVPAPKSSIGQLHDLLENILIYALCWAFRPVHRKRRLSAVKRAEMWMSTKDLLDLYGRPESVDLKRRPLLEPPQFAAIHIVCEDTDSDSQNEMSPVGPFTAN